MIRGVVTCAFVLMISCVQEKKQNAVVYLSNYSFDKFDKSFMEVLVDDKLVLSDSVNNRYLSFYWQDSTVTVPNGEFNLKVKVNSYGYELVKDTTVSYHDSLKVFVTFRFEPYYKRYNHPDIYNYFEGETTYPPDEVHLSWSSRISVLAGNLATMSKLSVQGAELLEAWRASGLSRRKFCMQNGVSYSKFNYWFRRHEASERSGFEEIQVEETQSNLQHPLQIVFPSGAKVLFAQTPCADWLKRLVS